VRLLPRKSGRGASARAPACRLSRVRVWRTVRERLVPLHKALVRERSFGLNTVTGFALTEAPLDSSGQARRGERAPAALPQSFGLDWHELVALARPLIALNVVGTSSATPTHAIADARWYGRHLPCSGRQAAEAWAPLVAERDVLALGQSESGGAPSGTSWSRWPTPPSATPTALPGR
jgi:hypothetical protein